MEENSDSQFVAELSGVKDAIGEWHDWQELSRIAKQITQHGGCKLIREIDRVAQQKFESALAAANRLRREYLDGEQQRSASAKKPTARVSPGLVSASALAA